MKEHIIEFKDLTDSREMMESKVPNFIIWFIYLILIMLISLLTWSWFSQIDIVVKGTGIVRPDKNVSIITNVNSGKMEKINYFEGGNVKKGELLYKIDTTQFKLEKEVLKSAKDKAETDLGKVKILEKSIKENKNLFSENEIEFYNRYISYNLKERQLSLDYEQSKTRYSQEKSLGLSFTTKSKLDELKSKMEYSKMTLEKNRSETLFSIKSELLNKEKTLLEAKNNLKNVEEKIRISNVVSPINGTVQIIRDYNIGDYVSSGIEILRIIPEGTKLKIELQIANKDIGEIKLNQTVKYRFLAFPYKEYGMIEGKVIKIPKDIEYDKNNASYVYKLEGTLPKTKLYSKAGKEGDIKIGMINETRIVTRRRKIFYIILEKLDFINL